MFNIEKLEVKDELLDGVQKFRITKEDGSILADNCTIELVTLLLQQGTDINKLLFDKIDANTTILTSKFVGNTLEKLLTENERWV